MPEFRYEKNGICLHAQTNAVIIRTRTRAEDRVCPAGRSKTSSDSLHAKRSPVGAGYHPYQLHESSTLSFDHFPVPLKESFHYKLLLV